MSTVAESVRRFSPNGLRIVATEPPKVILSVLSVCRLGSLFAGLGAFPVWSSGKTHT